MRKMEMLILKLMLLFHAVLCHDHTSTNNETHAAHSTLSAATSVENHQKATNNNNNKYSAIYAAHAQTYLDRAQIVMEGIYNKKRELFHNMTKKRVSISDIDHAIVQRAIDNGYYKLVYELAANLSVVPVQKLANATLRRQVQRLSKLQLYGLNRQDYEHSKTLLRTIQSFITTPLVCQNECNSPADKMAMEPTIKAIVEHNKNKDVLYIYWQKWRQALKKDNVAQESFVEYVDLWRRAAAYNGHVTPSRTWYLYYDTENFQRELEDVVWEIMPLYQELHAYLRHWARVQYGKHLTDAIDGAIPAPVMEQIITQDWYGAPIFRIPFPKHPLPTVKQRMEEVMETPVHMIKKASEFYESMNMNKLTKEFMNKFVRRINEDDPNKVCRVEVSYFPPDVALRFCNKVDYRAFLQMHGHIAELQYNMYKSKLPFGMDNEPCPGFGSALGEAFIIASGTPRHLSRLAIVANDSLPPEQSLNRLFRMGVHTLLAIPQYFVNDKYFVDVMDGRISPRDYNCEYWKLQHKYAGVVPPNRRNEQNFDPDYRFYKGLSPDKSNTIKFISEVMGLQFYRSFCLLSAEYKPGNPEHPLYNCDFYNSTAVGDVVKKVMKMGATKHWRDILQMATGDRRLSAQGVLEYFAPLYIWLKDQNRKLGLVPGWDDDIKCGNYF
ncbi:angiotensin-converting enzyme [Stomoxys calcitrans]|uniref:angiotensin-converting enzyme n=1 Tax=Stomoxys calcitrans TaxID=35570 RepID=UPI0027E231A3|nr:angiotensin-converting enzyme [Stomoxys calcitrans]XP_059225078.1 angiotensin-converting enzyme [Stomoxys calcitrans]